MTFGYKNQKTLEQNNIYLHMDKWVKIDSSQNVYFGVLKDFEDWIAVLRPCIIYEPILQDNKPEIRRYRLEEDREIIAQCTGIVPLTKDSIEELLKLNKSKEKSKKNYQNPNQLSLF